MSRLWGNPEHLKYLANAICERYPDLDVLVPKSNSGSFTYDGIELGGERVANEVETRLEELRKNGHIITKFSITGYSLGGLVARYAIGLLYHKGVFEHIQPMVVAWWPVVEMKVNTADRVAELHNFCHTTPWRPNTIEGIYQPCVERFRGQGTFDQWQTVVCYRQVPRHRSTHLVNTGRPREYLHKSSGTVQEPKPVREYRQRPYCHVLYCRHFPDGSVREAGRTQD